jgi:hypothetical protein
MRVSLPDLARSWRTIFQAETSLLIRGEEVIRQFDCTLREKLMEELVGAGINVSWGCGPPRCWFRALVSCSGFVL